MAETVEVIVTKDWVQVSPGQCEVQSVNDRSSYYKLLFDLVIGDTQPSPVTTAFMRIGLSERANFHRESPVWLRLNDANADKDQPVVVIK